MPCHGSFIFRTAMFCERFESDESILLGIFPRTKFLVLCSMCRYFLWSHQDSSVILQNYQNYLSNNYTKLIRDDSKLLLFYLNSAVSTSDIHWYLQDNTCKELSALQLICLRICFSYVRNGVDNLKFVEISLGICHKEIVFLSYNCNQCIILFLLTCIIY